MYIGRVVLNNIKGFRSIDLDFTSSDGKYPGWAVVTGDNGAGKTALLRAISLAILGPEQSPALAPDLSGWVTIGEQAGTISVEVAPDHQVDRTKKGGYPSPTPFWAEIEITLEGRVWVSSPTDVLRNKKKGALNGPWQMSTSGWFMVAYGPFRRMYGSSPDAQRLMVLSGRAPQYATLFKEDATLGEGEEWMRQLKHKRLEERPEETRMLDALTELIADDFLRQGVCFDSVDSDGVWLRDAQGRRLPLKDMSDGYRSTFATLVDIFRHMVTQYGVDGLVEQNDAGRKVIRKPGVVLIDEVDAHLHPEWQRQVGFWFTEHFPNLQFIVTTHSPLVCQAATGGRIYHIPALETGFQPFRLSDEEVRRVVKGRADTVLLSPAFGLRQTRSPLAVRARRRHSQLMAKQLSLGELPESDVQEMQQLAFWTDEGEESDSASGGDSFA